MSIANTDEQMRYELLARDMFLSDLATDLDAAEKKGRQEGRQEGIEKGREEGREEGIEKGKVEIALKMIAKDKSFEEISEITELPIDQIKKLAENNKVSEPSGEYKTSRKTTKKKK